jgi:hypothetical protein
LSADYIIFKQIEARIQPQVSNEPQENKVFTAQDKADIKAIQQLDNGKTLQFLCDIVTDYQSKFLSNKITPAPIFQTHIAEVLVRPLQ